jgi:hypothetical protein
MLQEFYFLCPGPEKWTMENRRSRLMHAVLQLQKMMMDPSLQTAAWRPPVVPHFFLPQTIPDIMADVPQEERDVLYIMFYVTAKLL